MYVLNNVLDNVLNYTLNYVLNNALNYILSNVHVLGILYHVWAKRKAKSS